jgi:hypothetical protein
MNKFTLRCKILFSFTFLLLMQTEVQLQTFAGRQIKTLTHEGHTCRYVDGQLKVSLKEK